MTEAQEILDGLPTARRCPFDPPVALGELRERQPIARMTYPDGHLGWLATSYELAREVLTNPAFSARHELRHSPIPFAVKLQRAMPGMFIGMDPPDHTRYRKSISRAFSPRRIRELEPAIEQIAAQCLDDMEKQGPPVDLLQAFALPLPVLVICKLLGADTSAADEFQQLRVPMLDPDSTPEQMRTAMARTSELMSELIAARRASPGDDLLSELIAAGEFDDQELAGIAFLILGAGHETTAHMTALSTYLLLENDDLRRTLSSGQAVTDAHVNEFLRYLSIVQFVSRAALTDVELGGTLIREGETVTISIPAVNRDAERFDDPDTFHADGAENNHLAFGHGLHQCVGHNLARTELRIAIAALLRRFPALRLAASPDDLTTRDGMNTYGVHQLPVTW
jgi:cytochrome P450